MVDKATGVVTAVKEGSATIRATSEANSKVYEQCKVTVQDPYVKVSGFKKSIKVGESYTVSGTVYPENNPIKTVTWRSSDPSVATINSSGKITAVGFGSTFIEAGATFANGRMRYVRYSLDVDYAIKVSFNKPTGSNIKSFAGGNGFANFIISLKVGETFNLKNYLKVEGGTSSDVTWSVESSEFLSVNNGVITAKKSTKGHTSNPGEFYGYSYVKAKAKSGGGSSMMVVIFIE